MFLSIRKKTLIYMFVVFIVCVSVILHFSLSISAVSPSSALSIIIDAGHGGQDGGAVGKNGTNESFLNLQYAKEMSGW